MKSSDSITQPERERTDESLRTERAKTDQELLSAKKVLEEEADLTVEKARDQADAVLESARDKADKELHTATNRAPSARIAENRILEDEALKTERELADTHVEQERKEFKNALRTLLPLEREATDKTLLTERIRSDVALENRDDFLGMVCHDLRDLLNGIVIETEILLQPERGVAGTAASSSAAHIQRYAARMNRLIGDLVDIASIDAGNLSMVRVPGDTSLLLTEAVTSFQASASARGIALTIEGSLAPQFAAFDYDRMLQVLANVLTNALKFTERGGSISVSRIEDGTDLTFCISDTGPGIPADMLESIFERFWQAEKNDRRGIGLGLYISKCIVESHGGKMWAESTLGVGSRFFFTLPGKAPH